MELQELMDNMIVARRAESLKNSPQLLLGELILKLEAVKNKNLPLFIDMTDERPMGIDSWRGSYDELAIQTASLGSYSTDVIEKEFSWGTIYKSKGIGKKNPTVAEWIEVLKEAQGKTFTGYKGGDFLMTKNTPVWLSEHGVADNIYFVDVREIEDKVYLVTAEGEY